MCPPINIVHSNYDVQTWDNDGFSCILVSSETDDDGELHLVLVLPPTRNIGLALVSALNMSTYGQ